MLIRNLSSKQIFIYSKYIINRSLIWNSEKFTRFYSEKGKRDVKIMSECKGMDLKSIVKGLEDFAPTASAESWDNVGLLIDPMSEKPISSILLTNDLTEDVLKEAIDADIGLIVSYHPPIFNSLKSFTASNWKERLVITSLKNQIAIFSPHTSWDIVIGGVNDWLSDAFSKKSCEPITESGAGRLCHLSTPITLSNAIEKIKAHIGIPHLRLALARGKDIGGKISTVALCAGSGSSVLNGVVADLYLTGEMLHHDVLNATQNNTHVILCNHSDSERGFLKEFAVKLSKQILNGNVNVFVSKIDADPLTTV